MNTAITELSVIRDNYLINQKVSDQPNNNNEQKLIDINEAILILEGIHELRDN